MAQHFAGGIYSNREKCNMQGPDFFIASMMIIGTFWGFFFTFCYAPVLNNSFLN